MKPIKDLIYNPPKYSHWLFVGIAFALFLIGFTVINIDNSAHLLILWGLSLLLSGICYGYLYDRREQLYNNWNIIGKLLSRAYLRVLDKFIGRKKLSSATSLKIFTLDLIPIKWLWAWLIGIKSNISNQVTIPYLCLTTMVIGIYAVLNTEWYNNFRVLKPVLLIHFLFYFIFAFAILIRQGEVFRQFIRQQATKRLLKKHINLFDKQSLFTDDELLEWVKNTIDYERSIREVQTNKELFFGIGENIEEDYYEVSDSDYLKDFFQKFPDIELYKVFSGKVYFISKDWGLGLNRHYSEECSSVDFFIKYTDTKTAILPKEDIKNALSELEKATNKTCQIPILHWQIFLADYYLNHQRWIFLL